jgi:hypothetical protein
MIWILQHKRYGLGNFIMTTPAIAGLSQQRGEPIPCYFESANLKPLFADCDFIHILEKKPDGPPLFSSVKPKHRHHKETDSECIFHKHVGKDIPMPNTYVDRTITKVLDKQGKRAVAIFHGCLGIGISLPTCL